MTSLLHSALLACVLVASVLAGAGDALSLSARGGGEGCGMSCCCALEETPSCCAEEEPEALLTPPCGCDPGDPAVVLELNRIDWAPTAETVAGAADHVERATSPAEAPTATRRPAPETPPPRG